MEIEQLKNQTPFYVQRNELNKIFEKFENYVLKEDFNDLKKDMLGMASEAQLQDMQADFEIIKKGMNRFISSQDVQKRFDAL